MRQSQAESYSALALDDSEHVFEEPINSKNYKIGVGDQFLFSMIYPSGVMNMKLDVSPLGEILIPLIGKMNVNNLNAIQNFVYNQSNQWSDDYSLKLEMQNIRNHSLFKPEGINVNYFSLFPRIKILFNIIY